VSIEKYELPPNLLLPPQKLGCDTMVWGAERPGDALSTQWGFKRLAETPPLVFCFPPLFSLQFALPLMAPAVRVVNVYEMYIKDLLLLNHSYYQMKLSV